MRFPKRNFWFNKRHPALQNEGSYATENGVQFNAPEEIHGDGYVDPHDLSRTTLTNDKHQPQKSLVTLPPEIVCSILNCCDTLSVLSLRHSSRQFREAIQAPLSSDVEKKLFWSLLKKDRFYELCSLEEAGRRIQPQNFALCLNCFEAHPLDLFSPAQLAIPSRFRVCCGIEGRLTICEHASIGFNTVKFAAAGHSGQEACTDSHGVVPPRGPKLRVEWTQTIGGQFGLFSQHYIDHWEDLTVPKMSKLMKCFLKNVGHVQICPHTRGRDIAIDALFEEAIGSFYRLQHHSVLCRNTYCYTIVTFVQLHGNLPTGSQPMVTALVMEVRRNLGQLRVPTEKPWLAQIGYNIPPSSRLLGNGSNRAHQNTSTRVHLELFEAV